MAARHLLQRVAEGLNRRPKLSLTAISLLLAIQISPWWYPTPDGSVYLSMARSIAGDGSMTVLGDSHTVALPGYPLLVSPAFLWGERPFLLLSILGWLTAVVGMIGVYLWAARQFHSSAVLITALAMLNTGVWIHYRRTLKEIAFMTVMIWTTVVLQALCRSSTGRRTITLALGGGATLSLLVLIRYSGIVLAAGFGVALLCHVFRRRMRWGRAVCLALAVGLPPTTTLLAYINVQRQAARPNNGGTYATGFQAAVGSFDNWYLEGLRLRISSIGRITIPGMYKAYADRGDWLNPVHFVYALWLIPVAIGWWQLTKDKLDVLALSLPFYLLLYIIWPYDQGARFLVPMTPLLMSCIYGGLYRLTSRPPDRWFGLRSLTKRKSEPCFSQVQNKPALSRSSDQTSVDAGNCPSVTLRPQCVVVVLLLAHLGVALGYWAAIDGPRAWALHRQWPSVERLALAIQKDPGPVGMPQSAGNVRMLLQLAIDRHIRGCPPGRPADGDIRWLVLSEKAPVIPGFRLHQNVRGFALYSRTTSAGAGQAASARPEARNSLSSVARPLLSTADR